MAESAKVTIYGTRSCAHCTAARMLLTRKGVRFEDVVVSDSEEKLQEMLQKSGRRSVPQIFVGDTPLGGFDELCALDESGELDKLLAGSSGTQ